MPPNKPADSDSATQVIGYAAYAQAATGLVNAGRWRIDLLSYQLPVALYGSEAFSKAVKQLVLVGLPHARIRVLLNDPGLAAAGHRLVALGRQLSSYVEFRQLHPRDRSVTGECLIVDERQVLERRTPQAPVALRHDQEQAIGRARTRVFQQYWDAAEPAATLRRLHLG